MRQESAVYNRQSAVIGVVPLRLRFTEYGWLAPLALQVRSEE